MAWKGKFFGAVIGLLVTRNAWGAVMGALVGHMFDESSGFRFANGTYAGAHTAAAAGRSPYASVSDVFFRTTFELMGYIAKSDGRVSEAEIDAARRLMQELRLGPAEIQAAIACFRFGKSAAYDAAVSVGHFHAVCAMRHDLLRAFVELQLRAALAGNGLSFPARNIITRVAEQFGISGLEFAHMEASLRAQYQARGAPPGGRAASPAGLDASYAELEVGANSTDQEITKAYRRQMSRHHPDKLVANGLPESMAQVAKEKTQRIQEAYEAIRAARGMR
jgi:DnaJ like chaperone protein